LFNVSKLTVIISHAPFIDSLVVCACASRHYTQRPGLHHLLIDIARDAAAEALIFEAKSVEMVQAFLLLSVYPVPQKKWTDNRSWVFMGVAIRSDHPGGSHLPWLILQYLI
jgi:transcriptional regulatory protein LEU3